MNFFQMKNYPNLETERLLIRPTTIEDASFLYELMNSPKWFQFIGDQTMDTVDKVKNVYRRINVSSVYYIGVF